MVIATREREQTVVTPTRQIRRLAAHPGWIVVLASCAILVRASMRSGLNTDVFWQLASGNWMLGHHAVIRADVFSYTVHGRSWLAEEWGFEVLLASMVRHLGAISYWLLAGGACATALLVSAARWRRQHASGLWMGLLSILATLSLLIGNAPRPQSISYLFFAVELYVLTRARDDFRWLLALPPLVLVWANVHGSFVLGVAVLVLEAASTLVLTRSGQSPIAGSPPSRSAPGLRRVQPLSRRDILATLFASVAATLVNPHGPALWPYALGVSSSTQLSIIQEWQSPDFHSPLVFLALVVPVVLLVTVLSTGRLRTNLLDLVLALGLLAATLHSIRFAPYFGLAFCGAAASWEISRRDTLRRTVLTWVAAPVLVVALLAGGHIPAGDSEAGAVPVAAASFLQHEHGHVFSTYSWNDYLIARAIPVFVDGRTDLYFGTGVLSTYLAVSDLTEPPDPVLAQWQVRWVLWPAHTTLSTYLLADPRWHLARTFKTGLLFEAVTAH